MVFINLIYVLSNDFLMNFIGDNQATMEICERLLEDGFYAQGIRHPSVPEGSARLRLTPMATHSHDEIDAVVDAIAKRLHGVQHQHE